MFSCHELGDRARPAVSRPARGAAVKLESTLPGRLREQLRTWSAAMEIRSLPTNPLEGKTARLRTTARRPRHAAACACVTDSLAEGEEICTRLSPYRLLFSRRSWYVVGRSSLHRGTRTFNLGRIAEIELLDDRYQIPRGFSIERYLRNAWHLIPEPGPDREV